MSREEAVQDVEIENEGDSEEIGRASFITSDGIEDIKIQALKDCWAFQKKSTRKNKKTKLIEDCWISYRYVTDIGSVANRLFDMRLKNTEASTLKEISDASKQIAIDVRKEFCL